jgi:hypothetical protein
VADEKAGVVVGISEKLIHALPPAFLVLILLNLMFMGVLAYSVQHNADARNAMLQRIIESCLSRKID